ncbi:MAG: hypothetical protein RLZZ209_1312 [Bacteroidota bacterium]
MESNITFITAVKGSAKINPGIPQSSSPQSKASIATIGFMLTFEPTTNGVIKFASINCAAATQATTAKACDGLKVIRLNKIGNSAPIQIPI